MAWTEERVEILKSLWMKGLTASQIAAELGEGVTRNAVIGKVHRLKLAARAKPATSGGRTSGTTRASKKSSSRTTGSTNYSGSKRRSIGAAPMAGATALKPSAVSASELKIAREQEKELEIPPEERVSLLELSENKCKWPIGDPLNPDFHFCGRKSLEDKPYCEFHSKRAYHKLDRKKR